MKTRSNNYFSSLWYYINVATKVSSKDILSEHGRIFNNLGEVAPLPKKSLLNSNLTEWVNSVKSSLKGAKISKEERNSLSQKDLVLKKNQMKNAQAQLRALSTFSKMLVESYSSTNKISTRIKDVTNL